IPPLTPHLWSVSDSGYDLAVWAVSVLLVTVSRLVRTSWVDHEQKGEVDEATLRRRQGVPSAEAGVLADRAGRGTRGHGRRGLRGREWRRHDQRLREAGIGTAAAGRRRRLPADRAGGSVESDRPAGPAGAPREHGQHDASHQWFHVRRPH